MSSAAEHIRIDGPAADITPEALSSLGKKTFVEAFGALYAREDLNAFLRDKHAPDYYREILADQAFGVWAAFDAGDKPVGYLVAGPCGLPVDNMPDNSGELIRFYILGAHQGAGLGRRMLEPALNWLDEHFDHVYLSVYSGNFGAQRLYARYGFEKVQDYHFMVGDHADPEFILKRRTA